MTGLWVLLGSLVAAIAVGLVHRVRGGRFRVVTGRIPNRSRHGGPGPVPGEVAGGADVQNKVPVMRRDADADADVGADRGAAASLTAQRSLAAAGRGIAGELAELGVACGPRATLLQFSTAFCAPCRATRQVLADVARIVPGVAHVEVDAESHLELVRRLGVRRTPTVIILDRDAAEVRRASGAPPSRAAVLEALSTALLPTLLSPTLGQAVDGSADELVDVPRGGLGAGHGGLDGR